MTTTREHGHGHADTRDAVEVLDAEHEVIRGLLRALEGMAAAIDSGVTLPRADIDAALDTIRGFVDRGHHAKEELVLFPALAAAAPDVAPRLIRGLEGEHRASRKLARLLAREAPGTAHGAVAASARFARCARLYARLLDAHIRFETQELLPLMERALHPDLRAALAERFEAVEREETGAGARAAFEATIDRLARAYGD